MSDQNVNLLYVVDKVISKLEGRKGVLNLDFDDELVNDIRLEMAETIRESYAECALATQPQAPIDENPLKLLAASKEQISRVTLIRDIPLGQSQASQGGVAQEFIWTPPDELTPLMRKAERMAAAPETPEGKK